MIGGIELQDLVEVGFEGGKNKSVHWKSGLNEVGIIMEIVSVLVGNSGNEIGSRVFERIRSDGIDEMIEKEVCLDENGKIRAVLVDLDIENMNKYKHFDIFKGLSDTQFIYDKGRPGNWCAGHYTEGSEIISNIEDEVRKLIEKCNRFQGFQLFHSVGGCTGGGLGTLIVEKLKDLYYNSSIHTFSSFYSAGIDDRITEPYNAVLSMNSLIQYSDSTSVISNDIISKFLNYQTRKSVFDEMNSHIAKSCFYSFLPVYRRAPINGTISRYSCYMVPFQRLHFLDISLYEDFKINPINVFDESNSISSRSGGKLFSAIESIKAPDLKELKININHLLHQQFLSWAPKHLQYSKIISGESQISCLTSNSTGCTSLFKRVNKEFDCLYKRKAFIHWYTGEGMDSMEFECAQGNLLDMIEEYDHYTESDELESFEPAP